jgi:ketosteroid isomerase-like protein
MMLDETNSITADIWGTLHRHLKSVFEQDSETYVATTSKDLSLFEWFVTPHRQDGLDFHRFMIDHSWAGSGDYRYDLLEPRLQLYGDTAIVSYTFMLSRAKPEGGVEHRTHNESRVLIKHDGEWQIVHVHKSPAWQAPFEPK